MKNFLHPYKLPRLYSGKGDWYVYYHYKNPYYNPNDPKSKQWIMFKDRAGLNYQEIKETPKLRKEIGQQVIDTYKERLKAGWSPFADSEMQSEDYDNMKFLPAVKALEELQKIKKSSIKRRTWQSYKYSLDVFSKWLRESKMEHVSLEFLKPVHMTTFFDTLRSSGNFKNKSINNHAANLGVLFNAAVERELCTKSPLKGYKKLPEESGKNYPFSDKQKKELKKKILEKDPDLWLFVKCIYHLFVRPIELLRVQVQHINLKSKQIIIHSDSGKNKKQLPVEIPDSFIEEIKALNLEQYPDNYYLFGLHLKTCPKPYNRNSVTERHTAILKAVGITDSNYTMYGWKHTGNVDAFLAGVDPYDLMRQNRHHSLEQTMNYLRSLGLRPNIGYSKKAPKM